MKRNNNVYTPTLITLPNLNANEKVISVVSNTYATFVLTNQGRLFGMGASYAYLIGGNNSDNIVTPTLLSGPTLNLGEIISKVYLGGRHAMALTSTGRLFAWGSNEYGEFGNGSSTLEFITVPTSIPLTFLGAGESISMLGLGRNKTFVVTNLGRLLGWGANYNSELGIPASALELSPVVIPISDLMVGEKVNFIDVGVEIQTNVVTTSEGRSFIWGDNSYLQTGVSTDNSNPVLTPTLISYNTLRATETIVKVMIGLEHTVVITSDGRMYGFGSQLDYRLGNYSNSYDHQPSPVIISVS